MLLVDDILFAPVRASCGSSGRSGISPRKSWTARAKSITEQLRTLYMQLETGRITEAEF